MPENNKNLPQDVQRIVEKAKRGEELNREEIGTLGGHGISLNELGIQEPHEREGNQNR